ncbi:MAG: hypothetical protein DCC74_02985 [Proteobacteria bacterium]|nr:MAG: hypothetical protein DCC74_02985 [Pseudomonadota bacterium]
MGHRHPGRHLRRLRARLPARHRRRVRTLLQTLALTGSRAAAPPDAGAAPAEGVRPHAAFVQLSRKMVDERATSRATGGQIGL